METEGEEIRRIGETRRVRPTREESCTSLTEMKTDEETNRVIGRFPTLYCEDGETGIYSQTTLQWKYFERECK